MHIILLNLNCGNEHSFSEKMAGHDSCENCTKIPSFKYDYNEELNPIAQKIYDNDGNTLAKWLFENGKHHLPFAALSYEEFNQVNLEEDEPIGAVFCTKNYEAAGHTDND
jgi:hypothetical protein